VKIHQIFTISIISFVLLFFISIHFKIEPRSQIILDIPSGSSATTISIYLDENKIILSPMLFKIYAKLSFADKKFKAGEYKIETPHSIYDLSKKITSGDFYYRKLTLLPGLKVSDILKLGDSKYLINDLKKNPYEVMKSYGIEMQEGIFFADTYYYLKGESFSSVLIKSNKKWIKFSQEIWKKRTRNLPFKNLIEATTLASIIEKEGVEKRKIASVFVNRLKKNMRLQSDPTVIYALGNEFDGNLTRQDLRIDHPYNTYRYKGLPPGPISIVSQESLEAALNPLSTEYFYFVSMGNGFHKFSKTLPEHNEAVLKYQINAR